jgi:cob(I)alamin adenosyltransferase
MTGDRNEGHAARMQRKNAVVDAGIAAAQVERGVLLVHTGNGKGKSSTAFGLVARALGHGLRVAVIQFVKARSDTGEEGFFRRFADEVRWHVMGAGFTWETQDRQRDADAAQAGWALPRGYLADPGFGLAVLDEMTYALRDRWLDLDSVLATIAARPPAQHVVVTGRGAPEPLRAAPTR